MTKFNKERGLIDVKPKHESMRPMTIMVKISWEEINAKNQMTKDSKVNLMSHQEMWQDMIKKRSEVNMMPSNSDEAKPQATSWSE